MTATLERIAQDLANKWCEPVLLITEPPPVSNHGYRPTHPYATLLSCATAAEKAAKHRLFEPWNGK